MQPARALFADATLKIGALASLLAWFICLLLALAQRNVGLMILFSILGLFAAFSRWYCMDHLKARQRRDTDYDRARQAADRLSSGARAALRRYLADGQ